MKLPESLFSRMLLAYLPFMLYPYGFFRSGVAALWSAVFLWGTLFFFWFTRRLFPGRLLKQAFLLWLVVWGQAAWSLTGLSPFWILSVYFMTPVSFLEAEVKPGHVRVFSKDVPRYFFERAMTGIGFVFFVLAMVFVREIGEKSSRLKIFCQPAGLLFVVAGIALLWKSNFFLKFSNTKQIP